VGVVDGDEFAGRGVLAGGEEAGDGPGSVAGERIPHLKAIRAAV
jgi:hypothetical protein